MRRSLALLALVLVVVAPAPARAAYGSAEVAFTFADPAIVESSGVAAARANPGILFTHNDSGDGPRFFAVDGTGATVATYAVSGAGAVDWEDMAAGPAAGGGTSLFFADIGNNLRERQVLQVFEVAEPEVAPSAGPVAVAAVAGYSLVYSDGPHDAEAFVVTPDRELVVITKEPTGVSGVYVATELVPGLPLVLHRIATINLPLLLQNGGSLEITGADLSADGTQLAVTTYARAFEWSVTDGDLAAAVEARPTFIELPAAPQREAIAYTAEGDLVLTTEGLHSPVLRLRAA